MTGEDEVLRRLAPASARIDVCADETGALPRDERAPVVGLADDGIGGGEVADERRPLPGHVPIDGGLGTQRSSQISAATTEEGMSSHEKS